MLLTTIGTDYWPRSLEARLLTLFLSLYALAILGYVAASLAAFFIGREAEDKRELSELRDEMARLRDQLQRSEAAR